MAISGGDGSIILTTKVDESGLKKGLGSMGGAVKSFAAGVAKSFLAIGVAAGAAAVSITKMAVSAYADYEQLVGGVETLFKGSAYKVMKYAEDAFFTAGVSANEYMQQVTSFSASLIRSTAGDTDKAADIANMALIDISDNVNKMGSSMESVTLAYQGFAKQQYMLLDNLKLGYGGTKTEMERLLKDAQALTGVKYDINNLADVYSAIHAIQEELGIAGTTAKEAEKTISGSAKMMKSAWQNVLSSVAGGGNLDRAINNLVYSIQKYFENIVPVVERALRGIGELVEKVAPLLVQAVAKSLIKSIPNLVNAVYQMIIGLAKGIYEGIMDLFSGAPQKTLEKQTNEIKNSANNQNELKENIKETNKELKKSLAGFDDLQIITSGVGANIDLESMDAAIENSLSSLDSILGENKKEDFIVPEWLKKIGKLFEPLKNIKFDNLINSLKKLAKPIKELADISWDVLEWAFKDIIAPIASFVVEDALPNFFEKLGDRMSGLNGILKKINPLIKDFWKYFLQPILSHLTDKLMATWEDINDKFDEFEKRLAESEIWADLQTIFRELYPVIVAVVNAIISLVDWIANITNQHIFNDLMTILSDLEDLFGLVAAVINGDFSDAWKHLSELLWDNRLEDARQDLELVGRAFGDIIGIFKIGVDKIKELLSPITDWINEKIVQPIAEFFAPIFDAIEEVFNKAKEKFIEIKDGVVNAVSVIWSKISEIFNKIKEIFSALWWAFKEYVWSKISNAVSNFYKEKIQPIVDKIKNVFSKAGNWFREKVIEPVGEGIKRVGTTVVNFISNAFKSVINGVLAGIEWVINGFIKMLNGAIDLINKIPGVNITKVEELSIPRLAQGSVVPPNREFLAVLGDNKREHEIVSPLSTMKQAFMEAMAEFGGNIGGGNTEVILEIDGREFGRAIVEQGNREKRRIGTRLVTV
jgi:phage-related protein